ncbi:MAG: putative glycoside hydrolase [Cellulosilyticaceae bacterium]
MKKYKIKPYQSYYRYKQKKLAFIRLFIVAVILTGIIFIIWKQQSEVTGAGFKWNDLLPTQTEKVEPVYFKQEETLYNVHNIPPKVKAVYLPAGYMSKLDEVVRIANETEVNAVVVDIKDDFGYLTFKTDTPALQHMVKEKPPIAEIDSVVAKLYENNIYPIARIVTFKDKVMAKKQPDRMVKKKDGTIFTTPKGETWLDPYNKENWDYILEVCQEAVDLGFREIQFDYVRFHESMDNEVCDFPEDQSKVEIITEFIDYVYERLHAEGVVVSADVFGTIITSKIDAEIVGQDYKELLKRVDYICPMIYPSHYGPGSFGVPYPDMDPYAIVLAAMQYSNSIMKEIPREERKATVRPWLQDFTATWVNPHQVYGGQQVKEQIDASYDALIDEWILWNAVGRYSEEGLAKE